MSRLRVEMTCGECPEQYDVYCGDREVGYLRLRHGLFRADYFRSDGVPETVYWAEPEGSGRFLDHERKQHLARACEAIREAMEADDAPVLDVQ